MPSCISIRERERERERHVGVWLGLLRKRERERERGRLSFFCGVPQGGRQDGAAALQIPLSVGVVWCFWPWASVGCIGGVRYM